jgi:hypothetical protein
MTSHNADVARPAALARARAISSDAQPRPRELLRHRSDAGRGRRTDMEMTERLRGYAHPSSGRQKMARTQMVATASSARSSSNGTSFSPPWPSQM